MGLEVPFLILLLLFKWHSESRGSNLGYVLPEGQSQSFYKEEENTTIFTKGHTYTNISKCLLSEDSSESQSGLKDHALSKQG